MALRVILVTLDYLLHVVLECVSAKFEQMQTIQIDARTNAILALNDRISFQMLP